MNNFAMFLLFILILTVLFMAFPQRGRKATRCLIQLIGALFISKAFQAIIAYFKGK